MGYRVTGFPAVSNPCHGFHWQVTYQHAEAGKFDMTMIIDRPRLALFLIDPTRVHELKAPIRKYVLG